MIWDPPLYILLVFLNDLSISVFMTYYHENSFKTPSKKSPYVVEFLQNHPIQNTQFIAHDQQFRFHRPPSFFI